MGQARLTEHPCPQCKGALAFVVESTDRGSGCIVAALGLLLAPLLLGIPILIYGFILMNRTKSSWHCSGCGRVFPNAR